MTLSTEPDENRCFAMEVISLKQLIFAAINPFALAAMNSLRLPVCVQMKKNLTAYPFALAAMNSLRLPVCVQMKKNLTALLSLSCH